MYEFTELNRKSRERAKKYILYADEYRAESLTEELEQWFVKVFFPKSIINVEWCITNIPDDSTNVYGSISLEDIVNYIYKHRRVDRYEGYELDQLLRLVKNQYVDIAKSSDGENVALMSKYVHFYNDLVAELSSRGYLSENDKVLINRLEKSFKKVFVRLNKQMIEYGRVYMNILSDVEAEILSGEFGLRFEEDGTVIKIRENNEVEDIRKF